MRLTSWLKGSVLGLFVCLACWLGSVGMGISTPLMNSQSTQIASNSTPPVSQAPPKVVFFGSSTTVGLWASRGDRRWSTLLSRYLGWQEINESLSGSSLSKAPRTDKSWPIPAAVQRWREIVARRPDRIVMLYGVNDAFWKLPLGDEANPKPETFRGDLETLLAGIKTALPPDRLIVVTPQPNKATQDRRLPYDRALQAGAEKIGAHFIDAGQEAFPVEELANYSADGLHLNNLGHAALASYVAGKLVDLGVVPAPPMAKGGHQLPEAREPLPGGWLRIDSGALSFGEIRKFSARWTASGRARFAVMRPDGRGGYEVLYRTPVFPVSAGIIETNVPRWWVLEGDRLAVWTDSNCLGSQSADAGSTQHLTSKLQGDTTISDVRPNSTTSDSRKLAVWTS